ncbi:MAG: RNA methyltransferase [Candidatus Dojkabacteria bacterium]|nr:MAG: RNA methyltransferase [Candidatus Dojkabacteria bacterium]
MPKRKYAQIENKNAILEILEEGKDFEKIYLANNAFKDPKTKKIMQIANARGIPVEKIARRSITRRSKTSSAESVIALMEIDNQVTIDDMLQGIYAKDQDPFILVFSDVRYGHNIGAIFRTAFAAGVNGVITPVEKANLLSDETIRISMGTCLRIPIAEMSLFAALKELQRNAIEVVSLDMEGESLFEANLTGPKALVLGAEDIGVSPKLLERSDRRVKVPMHPGLGALNVGVSAAVVMYEKYRQDTTLARKQKITE